MIYLKERYENVQLDLEDAFSLVSFEGRDAESFLSSGLTSNVKELASSHFHPSARVGRTGRIIAHGYLLKETLEKYYFLLEENMICDFMESMNQYIIMDAVEMTRTDKPFCVEWIPQKDPRETEGLEGFFWGELARVLLGRDSPYPRLNKERSNIIKLLNGHPLHGISLQNKLVNETFLNEEAVDYNKGCFLGQETVAKIHNNRGASSFPVVLKGDSPVKETKGDILWGNHKFGVLTAQVLVDHHVFLMANVKRRFRVKNKAFDLRVGGDSFKATLLYIPLFKDKSIIEKAHELYAVAVEHFKQDREEMAVSLLKRVISMDPGFQDAYESLGVILGRQGHYEKAVELMDKLLKLDNSSVMAHTNKSLYFMKMGNIEKAEEEKSLATVVSFQQFGKEAEEKKKREERELRQGEEMIQKERMFQEVLAIDAKDSIANFGLGEIAFRRRDYPKAQQFFECVLKNNELYSKAYLLLGKSLESQGKKDKARKIYEQGVQVASRRGDMMPANEMQERLLKM